MLFPLTHKLSAAATSRWALFRGTRESRMFQSSRSSVSPWSLRNLFSRFNDLCALLPNKPSLVTLEQSCLWGDLSSTMLWSSGPECLDWSLMRLPGLGCGRVHCLGEALAMDKVQKPLSPPQVTPEPSMEDVTVGWMTSENRGCCIFSSVMMLWCRAMMWFIVDAQAAFRSAFSWNRVSLTQQRAVSVEQPPCCVILSACRQGRAGDNHTKTEKQRTKTERYHNTGKQKQVHSRI